MICQVNKAEMPCFFVIERRIEVSLLRIKWENITTLLIALYIVIMDTKIFIREGFDFTIFGLELMATILVLLGWNYIVRITRKCFLEQ